MKSDNIAIIGGGNLGSAIAIGAVRAGIVPANKITITRRQENKLKGFRKQGLTATTDNAAAVRNARIVILCVQPKQLAETMAGIRTVLKPGKQILVSTITGISTEELSALAPTGLAIVRAMPNTAIAIGASMTCLCARDAGEKELAETERLFAALGKTIRIEERLMKAATVLAASGIAFFMRYLRAATQGGIQLGFDAEEAQLIATQTAQGAASLLLANHSHPEVEIDRVTTPEGCTIAGINEMEHQGLSSALIKGIMASFEKINKIKS